jgi:hypothetical protein
MPSAPRKPDGCGKEGIFIATTKTMKKNCHR